MAEPKQLPSGRWRVRWIDAAGKRQSETFATITAARAALRKREVARDDIRAGIARPRCEQTISERAEEWLAERAPNPNASPGERARQTKRHADNCMHVERHIKPALGNLRLPDVTADVVRGFVKRLQGTATRRHGERNDSRDDAGELLPKRTLRPATIRNVCTTLSKMLHDSGYTIRLPSVKVQLGAYNWIRTPAEAMKVLDACGDGWFRVAASLALYCGLRRGEIAALLWRAIDFEREVITIDRSWEGPTKSGKPRTVPLASELAELLKRWRMRTGGALGDRVVRIERVRVIDGDREVTFEPMSGKAPLAKFTRRACKVAGIEPLAFHGLRHSAATLLAERMPIRAVQELLGHVHVTTTQRYAHADSATAARDPRARLTFGGEAAQVIELHRATTTATGSVATTPEQPIVSGHEMATPTDAPLFSSAPLAKKQVLK